MAITKVTTPVADFDKATSLPGLKIPSGTNGNQPIGVSAEQGMIRNDTEETVDSSASALTHYNGTAWQYFAATESPDVEPLVVDYLVVAGGGAGQGVRGGGGGAGGILTTTSYGGSGTALNLVAGTAYAISIGNGGVGYQDSGNYGQDGFDSYFDSINTNGGGGGGRSTLAGRSGGSGGGGGNGGSGYSNQGGAATPAGQGSPGGRSPVFSDAGGGGGATGPNPAGFFNVGATGLASTITGASVTYATGGRGGYSSQGSATGVNGAAGTGNGGSGMYDGYLYAGRTAGSGGSGVVILRYPDGYTPTSNLAFTDSPVPGSTDRVITLTQTAQGTVTFTIT